MSSESRMPEPICQEAYYPAGDGAELFYRRWLPKAGCLRGVVVLVHGVCEHGGRYDALARTLVGGGLAVYAADLRGHGRSPGARIAIRAFDDYLDDQQRLLDLALRAHPGQPLFLLGHSMGGAIVLRLVQTRAPAVRGIVLSAPSVCVAGSMFRILRHLAWLVSRLFPWLRLVRVGSGNLSRDPAVVQDFRDDPLVYHGKFPARTGAEILAAGPRILDDAGLLRVPLLLLHGTGDRVTDPAGSQRLFDRAAAADKGLRLYPGLYHDLFHEPEYRQITAEVLQWLVRRCGD